MRWPTLLFCALPLVACAGPAPPPERAAPAVASPAPLASSSVSPPSPPAAPTAIASAPRVTPPPPYPEEWISEAKLVNQKLNCAGLVYKRGCHELRHGSVTVEITLASGGEVTGVELIENTVSPDPEVVWGCAKQNLPKWQIHAPEGVSPIFRLTLRLADKC